MKRWSLILLILAVGLVSALWFTRSGSSSNPGSGQPLSASVLARLRVSGGGSHALAIGPDGSLWSWGQNSSALGQGDLSDALLEPTRVGTDRDWAEIYAGYGHSLAIKQDGSLWAWGSNPSGVLGDGTNQPQYSPKQVGTDKDWKEAGPGMHHSLGLKKDGTIWAWGVNQFGQLGQPELASTNEARRPVRVGTGTNWTAIGVGALHNLALQKDGTLWTWGDSGVTPVVAMNSNNLAPIQIGAETNWTAITAGYYHSCAVKRDGTLWIWGRNSSMLGNFPAGNFQVLRQLGTNTDWAEIYTGAYGNLARRKDGLLREFGRGYQTAAATGREMPGAWVAAGGGSEFSLAVAQDGTLWHWGKIPGATVPRNLLVDFWKTVLGWMGRSQNAGRLPIRETPEVIFRWDEAGAEK